MFNVQLFRGLLLVSNRLLLTLAGTGVVLGALTANGKTITVTDSTIATNIHQSLNIQLDLTAEITFYFEFSTDDFTDFSCLIVTPFVDLQVAAHAGLIQNLC